MTSQRGQGLNAAEAPSWAERGGGEAYPLLRALNPSRGTTPKLWLSLERVTSVLAAPAHSKC
eukprot:15483843-Alexandrium_andersonii.AAC.1